MSFDRPPEVAPPIERPGHERGQRGTFLDVLKMTLCQVYGLKAAAVVPREGSVVLFVLNPGMGSAEVGCVMIPDGSWFAWSNDPKQTIGPASDIEGTAKVVAQEVGALGDRHAG